MTTRKILWAVAAAGLIAASSVWLACSNDPAAEDPAGKQAAAEAPSQPADAGPGLPDIELAEMGGGRVSAADLLNGKPLLVWFWAPW